MLQRLHIAVATAVLTLCIASPARADKIVLSQYGISAMTLPYAIALDRGLFKDTGLDVDGFISSNGGGTSIRDMLASGTQFSEIGVPAVLAAVRQGIDLKIVYSCDNNMGEVAWVVKKDSPIKGLRDMKGRRMGFTSPQSATEMIAHLVLDRAGIAKDVQFIAVGAQGAGEAALDAGGVDAFPLSDPELTQTANKYRVLFRITDQIPQLTNQVGVVSGAFAKAHPDTIRKLILARKQAVEFIYAHPTEAAKVYAQVWKSDDAFARNAVAGLIRLNFWSTGEINPKALDNMEAAVKLVAENPALVVDWRTITDTSFLPKR